MTLERLSIEGVRILAPVEITPGAGLNWFQGPNGAGKTSVLEAIFLLARGRSFRSHRIGSVIQHGSERVQVVARRSVDGKTLGMERSAGAWRGRIGGRECLRVSEFAASLPLVLMQPDSHRLIDGGPENRRQYLDWQLFHVEPPYLETWQRYARYLRQRNAALRSGASDEVLQALERPMAEAGERMGWFRAHLVEQAQAAVSVLAQTLGIHLPGDVELRYRSGYSSQEGLFGSLSGARQRDRELGFTRQGPHRGELVIQCAGQAAAQELSRGQQKLLALLLQLAQLRALVAEGVCPLLLLDDPVSELDDRHLRLVLDWLEAQTVQSWVTATVDCPIAASVFHVEQGKIERVL
ncbi:MAG: DNA replication/repair protein RecF [Wenzhouxiangella sp.]|jgi:DNA replication and repair protein RecF|nr:DNA replication/repair protein RecF [Wenzhouxiangella sp.]